MSIILQIGASHLSSAPVSRVDHMMGAGSEPDTMEAPVAPEDCGSTQAVTTTYANCFGLPYQDHNYGAPPPPTPPQSPAKVNGTIDEDTSTSVVTTSTTNEDDAVEEESITRCICEFDHDDEYMICCDKCSVWQHVDCMGLDRDNIPETYMCEKCEPRKVDRQKAKALQAKKREELTADSSSEESGDENIHYKTVPPPSIVAGKGKKVKRRKQERVVEEKVPTTPVKKVKRAREKPEPRKPQARKRRKSKSADMNHIDEDARDSWDSSASDWREKYEEAETNQYSPEVHLQLSNRKVNGHRDELTRKVLEHLQVKLCRVSDVTKTSKGLVAIEDIDENEIICEYRGKFLLSSQFQQQNPVFNNRLRPYVLFYSFHKDQEDVCVDSREYGNEARFIRRSCNPNAEVRHVLENGSLHLYIFSTHEIRQDEEITIPFDFDYEDCTDKVECACSKTNCAIGSLHKKNGQLDLSGQEKRSKRLKRVSIVNDESSQSSATGSVTTSEVHKLSPTRTSQSNIQPLVEPVADEGTEEADESSSPLTGAGAAGTATTQGSEEIESEHDAAERRKKMTREERKMEAIMKAFARLEKAQQRRQEALARLAHKKEEQEQKKKEEDVKKKETEVDVAEETKDPLVTTVSSTSSVPENPASSDEGKATPATTRSKGKGKKRKNSGTPARRRSRMNSGGSDILSPDEGAMTTSSTSSASVTPSPQTPVAEALTSTPTPSSNNGFKFPKTKKLMMSEWFSEKPEPVSQPLTIKTEPPDFTTGSPTCYMRSARSPTGISTAHLRRASGGSGSTPTRQNSADSTMGSAKKRWLRQAMCEEVTGSQGSPIPNGSMSPTQGANSPSTSPPAAPDLVTPLKKRRLARESMSSDTLPSTPPSTPSPSVTGPGECLLADCPSTSCDPDDEDGTLLSELSELQANLRTEVGLNRLKPNTSEDTMYEKAIAFLQKIPQDPSLSKSLESLQDFFKKDSLHSVADNDFTTCTNSETTSIASCRHLIPMSTLHSGVEGHDHVKSNDSYGKLCLSNELEASTAVNLCTSSETVTKADFVHTSNGNSCTSSKIELTISAPLEDKDLPASVESAECKTLHQQTDECSSNLSELALSKSTDLKDCATDPGDKEISITDERDNGSEVNIVFADDGATAVDKCSETIVAPVTEELSVMSADSSTGDKLQATFTTAKEAVSSSVRSAVSESRALTVKEEINADVALVESSVEVVPPMVESSLQLSALKTETSPQVVALKLEPSMQVVALKPESSVQIVSPKPESSIQFVTPKPESSIEVLAPRPESSVRDTAPKPESSEQVVVTKSELPVQIVALKPETPVQVLAAKPESTVQVLAPKPESSVQILAPKPESSVQILAPKPESSVQILAPKPESSVQILAAKPESSVQVQAPKPESSVQVLVPKPESSVQDVAAKPESLLLSVAPKPESSLQLAALKPESSVQVAALKPESSEVTGLKPESTVLAVTPKPDSSLAAAILPSSSIQCNATATLVAPSADSVTSGGDTSGSSSPANGISSSSVMPTPSSSCALSCTSEAAASELDVSNSQITSTSCVTNSGAVSQSSSASSSPAAPCTQNQTAKRKVSLLEYRKRKLENQSTSRSATTSTTSSSCTSTVSSTSVTSPTSSDPLRDLSTPPRLSTLPLFESTSPTDKGHKKDNKKTPEEDVRWNSAPTAVEQQRENLTQRLRREFGLITDEDSDSDKDKTAQEPRRANRTPPPPPPLTKVKGYPSPASGNTSDSSEIDVYLRTQNGRPIGCYPSHPPTSQPIRTVVPNTAVRNIPTIIGITGYQPQRLPPPPPPSGPPGVQNQITLPPPQQYSYQQFGGHHPGYPVAPGGQQVQAQYSAPPANQPAPAQYVPSPVSQQPPAPYPAPPGSQQPPAQYPTPPGGQQPAQYAAPPGQPPPQYAPQQVGPQYNGPPAPNPARPAIQLRPPGPNHPPVSVHPPVPNHPPVAAHQGPCTVVSSMSGSQPSPYVEQASPLPHVQPQPLLRPPRPPLLQNYPEPQHHYAPPPPPPARQQGYYPQGYYQ